MISVYMLTRNTLDCDQSNYSSRIVYSHIPIEFGQNGISAIKIRRPPKPHPRTKREVDRTTPRGDMAIWNFPNIGQMRKSVGRRSVLNIYFFLHCSHILLFATLGT